MEAGNTDDLLDYLKLDPDHHEKIASLIPQVGCFHIAKAWQGNEAWQSFIAFSGDLVRGADPVWTLPWSYLPNGLHNGSP